MTSGPTTARARTRRHRLLFVGIAVVLALTAFAGVEAASAHVSVPSQASPGDVITVQGSGFHAGQSGNLTYNGAVIEPFKASSSGSFSLGFTIPGKAPLGRGRISAKTTSSRLLATTTLSIVSNLDTPTPGSSSSDSASPSLAASGSDQSPTPTPTATPTPTPTASDSTQPSTVPNFSHVYVIVFENHEYSQIVGSSSAPYINSLIDTYGAATNFFAESHPSEPNYLALTSGSTQGVTDDGTYNLGVDNLFSQVSASGRAWHAYQQGYPGNCFTGSSSSAVVDGAGLAGSYVRKHDPAISYTGVGGNASECANITGLAGFDPAAADFELIVPNLVNSMHDGTIADGDNFLQAFLPQITGSAAFDNSVVFVTFDEGDTNTGGGGQILTVAITPGLTADFSSSPSYNHYSILRTIEDAWGLPTLGGASSAPDIGFLGAGTSVLRPQSVVPQSQPSPASSPSPPPTPSPTSTPASGPTSAPEPGGAPWPAGATSSRMDLLVPCSNQTDCFVYTVRAAGANGSSVNDDLPGIARYFGVSLSGIYALNPGLTPTIVPGQVLRIPPPTR